MRVGWYQWGVRGAVKKELDSNDSALGGGEGRGGEAKADDGRGEPKAGVHCSCITKNDKITMKIQQPMNYSIFLPLES